MAAFIFEPIHDQQIMQFDETWNKGLIQKGKPPMRILRSRFATGVLKGLTSSVSGGCLRELSATDRLYVSGHGNIAVVAGTRADGSEKWYGPKAMAELLRREGLTFGFRDLRIYTCNSGVGDRSFALQLKEELAKMGYRYIQVAGYAGDVTSNYQQFAGLEGPAELHKVAFAGNRGDQEVIAQTIRRVF